MRDCQGQELFTHGDLVVLNVLAQTLIGNKLVDDGLGGHHLGNDVAVILGHTHCPGQWNEDLGEYPLEVDVVESHQEAQPADDAVEEGNECHKGHNVGNDAQHNGHSVGSTTRRGIQQRRVLAVNEKIINL